ncbi:hypothetical protein ACLOJK_009409 [Asimina triloba]
MTGEDDRSKGRANDDPTRLSKKMTLRRRRSEEPGSAHITLRITIVSLPIFETVREVAGLQNAEGRSQFEVSSRHCEFSKQILTGARVQIFHVRAHKWEGGNEWAHR